MRPAPLMHRRYNIKPPIEAVDSLLEGGGTAPDVGVPTSRSAIRAARSPERNRLACEDVAAQAVAPDQPRCM